jgi:hypothetical protein
MEIPGLKDDSNDPLQQLIEKERYDSIMKLFSQEEKTILTMMEDGI